MCSGNWQALKDSITTGDANSSVPGIKYLQAGWDDCADTTNCSIDYNFDDATLSYLGPMGTTMDLEEVDYGIAGIKFYDSSNSQLGIHTTC